MAGGKRVRPAHDGGDRRFGRSLAETLRSGKTEDALYDEAVGPPNMTRRPHEGEWEPYDIEDIVNRRNGRD